MSNTLFMDLLFPAARQRVLALLLLQPQSAFPLREIARLTGSHAGTVAREMDKLSATGLLLRSEQGNQVRHSPNRPKEELDLVLFLNGIAVATVALKSDFTQGVQDAVDQYRFDRHPSPKGGVPEPLLGFPGGALVHFTVSQRERGDDDDAAGRRRHGRPALQPWLRGRRQRAQPGRFRHGLPVGRGVGTRKLADALLHATMSTQALGSERVRDGLQDILLGPAQLYEALRARSGPGASVR